MQVGDLVTLIIDQTEIGVIIQQVGVVDRWFVQWCNGVVMAHHGYTLEVLCK